MSFSNFNVSDHCKIDFFGSPGVQDILKKEDGAYIKYAMGSMLDMRYQVRCCMYCIVLHLLSAGSHANHALQLGD